MSNWPCLPLADCCEIVSGATPSTSVAQYWDGGICWATPKDLSGLEGHYISSTARTITGAGLGSCATSILPINSVLFSSRAPIGHVAINTVPMATNQGFKSFIPRAGVIDSKYLYHWLRLNRAFLENLGVGATFKEVSKSIVSRIEIPIPPIAEQRRIAAILDQADALRAKRREALAKLDELKQSIFIEMFGDPVRNSAAWQIVRLGDHVSKLGSGSTPTGGDAAYKESGISLIRSLNVHDGAFTYKNLAHIDDQQAAKLANVSVAENDILLNITGASVARVCRAPEDVLPAKVNQHVMIIRPKPSLNNAFLERLLLTPQMKSRLLQISGAGATREAITKAQAEELPVICPPIEMQRDFERRLRSLKRVEVFQMKSLGVLDNLCAALQHRAFAREL